MNETAINENSTVLRVPESALPLDHERCAQEQVQIIGSIQSHGMLFALSEPDLMVRQVSANVSTLLGMPPANLLGDSFQAVLGIRQFESFRSEVLKGPTLTPTPVRVPGDGGSLRTNCIAHRHDNVLIVELELLEGAHSVEPINIDAHLRTPLSRIEQASDILQLSQLAADEIRKLSGFARVMIYRFDENWNGEVIGESMSPSPVSYFGLRFPAGDIPPQVRQLFLVNPYRAIADAESAPVRIIPEIGSVAGRALDLTRSILRSASPIHIEYLRNMGVQSSMTVSIIVAQQLWGMIACHDPAPRRVDHSTRSICELIAQILASQIASRIDNGDLQSRLTSRKLLEQYVANLEASKTLAGAEHLQSPLLLDLFQADGLVCRTDGVSSQQGVTESEAAMLAVAGTLRALASRGIASSNMLSALFPGAAAYASQVSGALYIGLTEGTDEYLLLLRRELVETVKWAGNPNTAVQADELGRLHPRMSFAAWSETERERSRPWSPLELENASVLREQLLRVRDAQKLSLLKEALGIAREAQAVQSGRADMASTVLHDIGNAITGIGTRSAQLLADPAWPENENLARLNGLLESQATLLGTVFGERKATALSGLVSNLERSLRQREITLREHVRSLVGSVSHVQDILAVQRQYVNQGSSTRSRVVLSELVDDAIAIQAATLERRAVQVVRRLPADLPRLKLDRTRMVQVLCNLIRNACESFDRAEDSGVTRFLEISAENAGLGRLNLKFKDNAHGFSPELADTFFERGNTAKIHGTGLGLYSCRSTLESHGGHIRMESEGIGKGAAVIIDLPSGQEDNLNDRDYQQPDSGD